MTGRPVRHDPPPWFPQAELAYRTAAKRGGLPAAAEIVKAVVDEHGPGVMPRVMLAWIDSALFESGLERHKGHIHMLRFLDVNTLERGTAADIDPDSAWAGQLMNARLSDDREMFEALLTACTDDQQWSRRVLALLLCCAITGTRYHEFHQGE